MKRVEFTVTFIDGDGTPRSESQYVESTVETDADSEHRLAHNLLAELRVDVGKQIPPKHSRTTAKWLEFPNNQITMSQLQDVWNSQAMWFELSSLVLHLESDLNLAHAFKVLEPSTEPEWGDDIGMNDLHYIHDRKMAFLNQAVYGLVKTQDLVNRLLHESLGGNLVDTSQPDWETETLKRENVKKGLREKRAVGDISQQDFDAIHAALNIPKKCPASGATLEYRNGLTHHIRPSVDYAMFFSTLESRIGNETRDLNGKVIKRVFTISARPPAKFQFYALYDAFSEYLCAIVSMLDGLSKIEILHR